MIRHFILLGDSECYLSDAELIKKHSFVKALTDMKRNFKVVSIHSISILNNVIFVGDSPLKDKDIVWNHLPPTHSGFLNIMQILSTGLTDTMSKPNILNDPKQVLSANSKRIPHLIDSAVKSYTYFNFIEAVDTIEEILLRDGVVVVKGLFSYGGKDVHICNSLEDAISKAASIESKDSVVQVEKFIFSPNGETIDKRICICNGEIMFNLDRVAKEGRLCCIGKGGSPKSGTLSKTHFNIAKNVMKYMKANGVFYCGIDIINNSLIEVNISSPGGIVDYLSLGPMETSHNNPAVKIINIAEKLILQK